MERSERPKGPGLKWRPRNSLPDVPIWYADEGAILAGYRPKSVRLEELIDNPVSLVARCQQLQDEMKLWLRERKFPVRRFDGSFKMVLDVYQTDAQSPYRTLKPKVAKTYTVYLRKLIGHIGGLYVNEEDGGSVKEWFAEWRVGRATKRHPNGKDQLPAATTTLAVLKAAVSWGVAKRMEGLLEFQAVLEQLEFPKPERRKYAPTAEQIIAARLAAHKNGAPRRALLYALQFETTGRQWDFKGAWWPTSDPRISAVVGYGEKWFGPVWSDIDENLTLTIRPTKTEDTTEVEITYDLSACPMVMEELAHFPTGDRHGPIIFNEKTGLPYRDQAMIDGWRRDYKLAGIPDEVWNRDNRAGGVTEGRLAGASKDDRRRLAGHADEATTDIYERGAVDLAAHRNVMEARKRFRQKNEK